MDELKSCPFCGGEASTVKDLYGFFVVACMNRCCNARIADYDEGQAIAAWNRRANDAE